MVKLLLQGLTGSRTSESEGKLDDSPHHRNISSNTKQCNVQIESLMFCKAIRHNATLFVSTLYHSKLRWAISRNATLFVCTLYHSTLRWAISHNTTTYVSTLYHLTLRCAIWRNVTPFVYCIQMSAKLFAIEPVHFTISCSNVTPFVYCTTLHYAVPFDAMSHRLSTVFKWVLSYSQLSQSISQFHAPTRHGKLDCLSFG